MPCPTRGVLEFDFVSGTMPTLEEQKTAVDDSKFLRVLSNCCLVSTNDSPTHLRTLRTMKMKCDDTLMVADGRDGYHSRSLSQGDQVHSAMDRFYDNLNKRSENFNAGTVRVYNYYIVDVVVVMCVLFYGITVLHYQLYSVCV